MLIRIFLIEAPFHVVLAGAGSEPQCASSLGPLAYLPASTRPCLSLHAGLESRAVIEQAKGILHAELGVSPAEAFRLLSRYSQNTNQRVRKISAGLVQGRIAAADFRPPADPGQA